MRRATGRMRGLIHMSREYPVPITGVVYRIGLPSFMADQENAFTLRRLNQRHVECGERHGVALGEFEIRGVVDGEAMTAR